MSADRRKKNINWTVGDEQGGITWERVGVAVLMDIRDELQELNALLRCQNFLQIPETLRSIKRNTAKQREKK